MLTNVDHPLVVANICSLNGLSKLSKLFWSRLLQNVDLVISWQAVYCPGNFGCREKNCWRQFNQLTRLVIVCNHIACVHCTIVLACMWNWLFIAHPWLCSWRIIGYWSLIAYVYQLKLNHQEKIIVSFKFIICIPDVNF